MSHEDKEKIKNILPSAYTYKFSDLCYKSELKYSTVFRVHEVNNEETFNKWFEQFKKTSKTGWITSNTASLKLQAKMPNSPMEEISCAYSAAEIKPQTVTGT
jgi:hypothetical protein